jgi:fucose 4-O-acetylase-like acetyltransferase
VTQPASQRVLTIDIAKGVGILLVVVGHNAVFRDGAHTLYEAVYLFHMPLFFFLSGLTFRLAPLGATAGKRARSLLVPYFAMGGVALVAALMAGGAGQAFAELRGLLYGTGHTIRFVPLWFLPCLFLVSVAAAAYLHATRRFAGIERFERAQTRWLIALAAVSFGVGAWLLSAGPFARPPYVDAMGRPLGLPWSLDLVPTGLAMFVAGMLTARTAWVRECPRPLLVIVATAGILAILVANDVSLDLNYRRMSDAGAVAVAIVAGILLVLAVSTVLARFQWVARPVAYLGSASLIILMLHSPLQRRVLEPLVDRSLNDGLVVVLSVAITVALICAFDRWVLRKVRAIGWFVYPRREAVSAS